jgi:4-hydroxysphinganine ceramide fatty acyl 2-hydroxylase
MQQETSSEPQAMEDKVDMKKAILWQIGGLGKDYEEWVYKPSFAKEFRMFQSDLFETFSKTKWYVVPIVWIPVIAYLLFISAVCTEANPEKSPVCPPTLSSDSFNSSYEVVPWCLAGIFTWSLIEYCLHRFMFHVVFSASPFWTSFHFIMHGQHHKFPQDKGRLVFPPVAAAILASLHYAIFLAIFPLHIARSFMAGALIGYVAYDLTHYFLHHASPTSAYFKALKSDHLYHHFKCSNSGE